MLERHIPLSNIPFSNIVWSGFYVYFWIAYKNVIYFWNKKFEAWHKNVLEQILLQHKELFQKILLERVTKVSLWKQ